MRNLFERALSVGLRKKSVISLLKKYLKFEREQGDEERVNGII